MNREEMGRYLYPNNIYHIRFDNTSCGTSVLTLVQYFRYDEKGVTEEWETVSTANGRILISTFNFNKIHADYVKRKFQKETDDGYWFIKKKTSLPEKEDLLYPQESNEMLLHLDSYFKVFSFEAFYAAGNLLYHPVYTPMNGVLHFDSSESFEEVLESIQKRGEDLREYELRVTGNIGFSENRQKIVKPSGKKLRKAYFLKSRNKYFSGCWVGHMVFVKNLHRAVMFEKEDDALDFLQFLFQEDDYLNLKREDSFSIEEIYGDFNFYYLQDFYGNVVDQHVAYICRQNAYPRI